MQEVYLRAYFASTTNKELARALNRTTTAITSHAARLGLHKSEVHKRTVSVKQRPNAWSADDDAYMRQHFPETKTPDVAAALGRSVRSIQLRATELGLFKSDAYFVNHSSRFKAGLRPWNTGKKGLPAVGNSAATQFKKGQPSRNQVPVGTITVRAGLEGKRQAYSWIKTAEPNVWQMLHRYNWEQLHGPIPDDCILKCRSDDTTNGALENWELITRSEFTTRKRWPHWQHIPEPIKECIRLHWQIKLLRREQRT